jgi:transcriptional regulator with XRE-family HTH domain
MMNKHEQLELGLRIKAKLKEMKRSQAWLAEQADIPTGYLNELINAKKRWNLDVLGNVSNALEIHISKLLSADTISTPKENLSSNDRFNALVKDMEFTPEQIAAQTSLTAKQVQDIIDGKAEPSQEFITELETFMEVPKGELVKFIFKHQEFIDKVMSLSHSQLKVLDGMIEQMKGKTQ